MPQKKILLDACSYFRLANNHHPLLSREFGQEKYCLYVSPELEAEYNAKHRLQTKFHWVSEPQYKANRSAELNLSRKQKKSKEIAIGFIADYAVKTQLGVSLPDIKALATAKVLGIPIVTDDGDMQVVAKEYDIKLLKSLELLKLMMDSKLVSMKQVRATVKYWRYNKDIPGNLKEDYFRIFNARLPK